MKTIQYGSKQYSYVIIGYFLMQINIGIMSVRAYGDYISKEKFEYFHSKEFLNEFDEALGLD